MPAGFANIPTAIIDLRQLEKTLLSTQGILDNYKRVREFQTPVKDKRRNCHGYFRKGARNQSYPAGCF